MGVLEWDAKMRDYLKNNDWRYPIVARQGTDEDAMDMHVQEVVTLATCSCPLKIPPRWSDSLAAPSTKIVSLTITEYGYRVPLNEGDHKLLELANQGVLDDPELSIPSPSTPRAPRRPSSASSSPRSRRVTASAAGPSP